MGLTYAALKPTKLFSGQQVDLADGYQRKAPRNVIG